MEAGEGLAVRGRWFVDAAGRRHLLRGVNLGGSSKVPAGEAADGVPTFVGRPFPLAEADEHLARIRRWGFTWLRLVVPWEAVEPAAPGRHDADYLAYLRRVVERAGEHGLAVVLDPHQDVWSRASGGSGAPAWTLAAVGFDVDALHDSGAAVLPSRAEPGEGMRWPENAARLAAATMAALFWAGDLVAPACRVDGEPVQRFLQRHHLAAVRAMAQAVAGLPHVLGVGTGNEPFPGFLGVLDLARPLPFRGPGPVLTGLQALSVPAGHPAEVPVRVIGPVRRRRRVLLNPTARSAWRTPDDDVWRRQGVWDVDARGEPRLLRPDHFALDVHARGYAPFARRLAATVREVLPGAVVFVEGEPGGDPPVGVPGPIAHAPHWYDVVPLFAKRSSPQLALRWGSLRPVAGRAAVRRAFVRDIAGLAATTARVLGEVPTVIGEYGVPFDLDGGRQLRSGDFAPQEAALTAYHDALDAALVHAALWNYTPDNTDADGDHWNGENLSVYSRDRRADDGARALAGFSRPSLRAAAGTPLAQSFRAGVYRLDVDVDPAVTAPTVVSAPAHHLPPGSTATATSGSVTLDPATATATWAGAAPGPQTLTLRPPDPVPPDG